MNPYFYIPIVVGIAAFVYFALVPLYRRWRENSRIDDALVREMGANLDNAKFKYFYTTPKGVKIRSTVEVPSDIFQYVDQGIQRQIDSYNTEEPFLTPEGTIAFRCPSTWSAFNRFDQYEVLFVNPTGISEVTLPGAPMINVQEYWSAGTCLGTTPFSSCRPKVYIVAPHQQAQNWRFPTYLRNTVDNESEHAREWKELRAAGNDISVFLYWAHSGDVHPHTTAVPQPPITDIPDRFGATDYFTEPNKIDWHRMT